MKELTLTASLENLEKVQAFVAEQMEEAGCSAKARMQIEIAVEEIYVNIARYAYRPGIGNATVRCEAGGRPPQVVLQFLDEGIPFNPLEKEDADITLSAEERKIGGLGILMIKKSMDMVEYRYEEGRNILTVKKAL